METVLTGVVTALKASGGVTALATGGIYNNVPQGTTYPYLVVTSPTDRREDTFGRLGGEVMVDVRAVSQAAGDQEAARMIDQCLRTLNFTPLTLSGHVSLGVAWDNGERYQELVNGIPTRHHVASIRIWTEQTSS